MDFTMARLPPSVVKDSASSPAAITAAAHVQLQHEHHFRAVPDEDEEGEVLALWHSMKNKPSHHMMGASGAEDEEQKEDDDEEEEEDAKRLLLPMEAMPLLMALMPGKEGYPKMAVADLPMEQEAAVAVCQELADLGLLVLV